MDVAPLGRTRLDKNAPVDDALAVVRLVKIRISTNLAVRAGVVIHSPETLFELVGGVQIGGGDITPVRSGGLKHDCAKTTPWP